MHLEEQYPTSAKTPSFIFTIVTHDRLCLCCAFRLKTLTSSEGRIRLSEDNGPPANEFLADDYDEDNDHTNDPGNETLSEHIRKATQATDRLGYDTGDRQHTHHS